MTIRAHRDAVVSELERSLPGAVYHSYQAAAKARRYAVVFIALSQKVRHRYTGEQARNVYTVTVHSVGDTEDSCLWVQERVEKLAGVRLSVPDRSVQPVEYVTGVPQELDDSGERPLWFAVSQFDIVSDPA